MDSQTLYLVCFSTLFGLSWGSFLNVIAYRLSFDKPFMTKRSYCPSCQALIAWYDNIPMMSWVMLRGSCRKCSQPISLIYPLMELITAVITVLLALKFFLPLEQLSNVQAVASFLAYFYFFTCLIVSTTTDLYVLAIPQLFTLWSLPLGIVFSLLGLLTISVWESMTGALFGYGILWLVAYAFKRYTGKDGLGVGDMELLGLIGAFLGPIGVWLTLMISSLVGSVIGGGYVLLTKQGKGTHIPFGPFLAFGATLYFFLQDILVPILFF